MKRVEIKLNISAVAPLLDVIKQAADDLKQNLAIRATFPEDDSEFNETWTTELLAGQNSDVRELLALFGSEFFAEGSIAIDSGNSDSLLRGCSALRIQILTRWLQGIPADLLEEEDVPPESISDAMRVPFAAYTFLDQVQKIILEHLDPTVAET
jgi:hypothetical protein